MNGYKNTYLDRFQIAIGLITGTTQPTKEKCEQWLTHENEDLQDLMEGAPWWSMNIGIIEAAMVLANNPIEGDENIDYSNPYKKPVNAVREYIKFTYDEDTLIFTPIEALECLRDCDGDGYDATFESIYLTKEEFEALPEFQG